jgi:hypothetical protein
VKSGEMKAAMLEAESTQGTRCPRPCALNTVLKGTPHMPIGIAVTKNSVASLRRLVWGGFGSGIGVAV